MFEPGHLHITHVALLPSDVSYTLDLRYQTASDPVEGLGMHFTLHGDLAGTAFEESFQLPRDSAFNFASQIDRIARRYGLPEGQQLLLIGHHDYDRMFADVREQLDRHSGDPMQPDHMR
jgi:hypothetical protein